jgi:hypothetical protein
METIRSLRPNVSLQEARQRLSTDGLRGALRKLRLGPRRSLAQIYIPFDSFRIEINRGSAVENGFLMVDAVAGILDPYYLEQLPSAADCIAVRTRNLLPRILSPELSQQNAEQRIRRLIFQQGFFRLRTLEIKAELQPTLIYVPYWVGFFGPDLQVRMVVIDAVRGQVEGAKVRVLLQQWFAGELLTANRAMQIAPAS